jgi:hypothetical protein
MARDFTKYTVEGLGENLNKRQLVFTIVKDWVEKNNPSFEELQKAFPDDVQGSKGFIRKESEVKDPKRFNMREPISIKNGMHIVVSNQWGDNVTDFIKCTENLGYVISKSEGDKIEKSTENSYIKITVNKYDNKTLSYVYIKTFNNENSGEDYKICNSIVAQTNGEYTLSFHLDNDGDGVIDMYKFCDIKTNVRGSNGSPWDFEEFTDEEGEWIEKYESFEDFGYDSSEIAETLESMRSEFIEKYLNEASQENWLDNAAVPFNKKDILKEEIKHDGVDYFTGNLVFELGDINIIPLEE